MVIVVHTYICNSKDLKLKKMKKLLLSLSALSMLFFVACGDEKKDEEKDGKEGENKEAPKEEDKEEAVSGTFTIDTDASYIQWESWETGKRDGHGHNGKVKLSGEVVVTDGEVTGGNATVDIASIYDADINEKTGLGDLVGHLVHGPDMFAVDSLGAPTVTLNSYDGTNINATLTIRGNSNEISFPASAVATNDGVIISSDKFNIDLTKYGIPFFTQRAPEEIPEDAKMGNMNPEGEFLVVVHAKK